MHWMRALLIACLTTVVYGGTQTSCVAGRYYDETSLSCAFCPNGEYQDTPAQTSCKSCPDGTSTVGQGSTSLSRCVTICDLGEFYQLNDLSCTECSYKTYNDRTLTVDGGVVLACTPCPGDQITYSTGTTSASGCRDQCADGQQLANNNGVLSCELCPVGTWRSGAIVRCVDCPSGETTLTQGATSQDDCVFVCPAGTFNNAGTCSSCPVGQYQDLTGQSTCKSCPAGSTTRLAGSDSVADCLFPCSPGSALVNNVCTPCPRGQYQPSTGLIEQCTSCSAGLTTATVGTSTSTDCIPICQAGSTRDLATGVCTLCPRGMFQPLSDQLTCQSCPSGLTTLQLGASSAAFCVAVCQAGRYRATNGQCVPCSLGEYQDQTEQTSCQACPQSPIRTTTREIGAPSVASCVPVCLAGTRITGSTCTLCQVGEYQPNEEQTTCIACTGGKTTITTGSTSESQCLLFCGPGTFTNGQTCSDCPIGTYKSDTSQGQCTDCGSGRTTLQTGSTSITQCVPICAPGQFLNGLQCTNCLRNSYQPSSGQTSCISCIAGFITASEASTSVNDCYRNCNIGEEVDGLNCRNCLIGYYQDTPGQKVCKQCPGIETTLAEGATREEDCLVVCNPGNRLVAGQCDPCPVNTYQPNSGTSTCEPCPANTGTYGVTAATQLNQCREICLAGQFLGQNGCELCALDTYQPQSGQVNCLNCPNDLRTLNTGSTSEADCVFTCPPGEQQIVGQEACEPCPKGTFKELQDLSRCVSCPSGFTTAGTGSSMATQCNLAYCDAGQFSTSATCEDCPADTYQEQPGQHACTPCPSNTVFPGTGSNSRTKCRFSCPTGSEPRPGVEDECRLCPVGMYSATSGTDPCDPCPSEFTTGSTGASTEQFCNIRVCSAGFRRDADTNTCFECGQGFYQPDSGQAQCFRCPPGFSTNANGNGAFAATSAQECFSTNECETLGRPCHPDAECVNRDQGYQCFCRPGFVGDGVTTCSHQCDEDGYCLNSGVCHRTDVGVRCQCTSGYTGDRCQNMAEEADSDTWKYIVGGVFGGFLFLALLALLIVLCCRCCQRQPDEDKVVVMQKQGAAYMAPSYIAAQPAVQSTLQPVIQTAPKSNYITQPVITDYKPQATVQSLPNYQIMQNTPNSQTTADYFSGV